MSASLAELKEQVRDRSSSRLFMWSLGVENELMARNQLTNQFIYKDECRNTTQEPKFLFLKIEWLLKHAEQISNALQMS